ncbi:MULTISPECIES: WxL domain-containing protein [Carnobacterium]|uniref:WxL domain-containing protein n=1 Tax=Carnobacterium TaxID=2747 RepID=UPI00288CD8AA|nr:MULTISPECIES: WxL domain-containing protein [Carnobacterium]MDT1939462.1 WxL domain-containing protein [Carnobacterium divergens]MDT1941900.1 WxL domain-containing protein [Carnobacterium divergens]MDT1947698.1 WxL domain-containing protein [Carnobacterium divergens]MDT1950186.1 WxL domain-containing protein [Carnobacterium divergens]MDT1955364.1 WxL domain-containing protein [Carnobacterium divergens]
MKKTTLITTSALALATLVGTSVTALAAPGEIPANYDSNAVVKFVPDDTITPPVDPTDPTNPVEPIDPADPEGPNPGTNGPLSIDFASSFYFGENKITSKDMIYNAAPQELKDGSTRPNYAQVTDNRGGAKGWKLQVKQNGQFKTTKGEELTGAMMSFTNGQSASESTSPVPSIVKGSFDLTTNGNGAVEDIMAAKVGEGAGTWVYRFGDDATKAESVTLFVPGKTTKMADTYSTKLTWTLTDVPDDSETPES